jgi:hypothetical protein
MIGWSLNLISKFLAIRLEILFFKIIPKDRLVLFQSRNWKTNNFRWFGRASSVLINHRKCSLSSDKWSIQRACNHQKCFHGQIESSCFRASQLSKFIAMIDMQPLKARIVGDDVRLWCSVSKGSKRPRIIHFTNHFKYMRSCHYQIRLHGDSLFFSRRCIKHH